MVKSLDWSVGPNSQFKPTTSKGSPKGSHKKNGKSLVRLTKRVDHGRASKLSGREKVENRWLSLWLVERQAWELSLPQQVGSQVLVSAGYLHPSRESDVLNGNSVREEKTIHDGGAIFRNNVSEWYPVRSLFCYFVNWVIWSWSLK